MAEKEKTPEIQPNELRAAIKDKTAKYESLTINEKIILLDFIKKDISLERDELAQILKDIDKRLNPHLDAPQPSPAGATVQKARAARAPKRKGKGTVTPELKAAVVGLLSDKPQDATGLIARLKSELRIDAVKEDVQASIAELKSEKKAKEKGRRWVVKA
ncbi:MAG: hypothetical protein ACLQVX_19550 [Limisphaerales bacterium]